jgi:hypothetical protein
MASEDTRVRHGDIIRPPYAVVYRDGEFHRVYGSFTWEIVPRGGALLPDLLRHASYIRDLPHRGRHARTI